MKIQSYIQGKWFEGTGSPVEVFHAVSGEKVGEVNSEGIDFKAMLDYSRNVGGPALRKMTFHERAVMLKNLALHLMDEKEELYQVSEATGATRADSWVDIEGGVGTFFSYSGIGRRELPNDTVYVDGDMSPLSKTGSFVGRHICVPMIGTALHINAFNFPCWGMLEKLAPTFLAGMPAIVKPASQTSYLTAKMVRSMAESGFLPDGALQLICGSVGDTFEHLTSHDVVTFTGSASTGIKLKSHPKIVENSIRFNMEADSLNCCILGPDAKPDTEEFQLFIKEVAKEMTTKSGQKCTAIRRTIIPKELKDEVLEALKKRLDGVKVGNPSVKGVRMGALVSQAQVKEVEERVAELSQDAELVYGGADAPMELVGADRKKGAFFPPTLLYCDDPLNKRNVHEVEAFGPVNTVMPYETLEEAIQLAAMGGGSLAGSLFTGDDDVAKTLVVGIAPHHGRLVIINRDCGKESTGHGSPMPQLVHGGPGRAGGGEEMGGVRAVFHYMQRTAIQGSPTTLTKVCNEWTAGAKPKLDRIHPFMKHFDELEVGDTLLTHRRTITEADVTNFAGISGDFFYAHTDEIAAKESPIFDKRVAHGYFVLSAAAGLFVHPAKGPVLANYGLNNLRFTEPIYIGDTIRVRLTCKQKIEKVPKEGEIPQGVVEWDVEVYNQYDVTVAIYSILTLVSLKPKEGEEGEEKEKETYLLIDENAYDSLSREELNKLPRYIKLPSGRYEEVPPKPIKEEEAYLILKESIFQNPETDLDNLPRYTQLPSGKYEEMPPKPKKKK